MFQQCNGRVRRKTFEAKDEQCFKVLFLGKRSTGTIKDIEVNREWHGDLEPGNRDGWDIR
jgi:hypothetical protein